MQPQISPFVMVIFGATGDLTARKLIPALYNLFVDGILPERFFVVGNARRDFSHEEFRSLMHAAVAKFSRQTLDETIWNRFAKNIYYQQGVFEEDEGYDSLVTLLKTFDDEIGACITRFFYLSTPPQNYSAILEHLSTSKLAEGCGQGSSKWTRVLIEKPFGKDIYESKKLEEQLASTFEERQIYRIDHYLAKETMQNMLVFRFANRLFEPIWNSEHIDHIQFTMAESGGIGTRGKFYEGIGAFRDVAQNHLMAMLAFVTMDEPKTFSAHDIHVEREKVLKSLRCIEPEEVGKMVVRGQYIQAETPDGKIIPGYRNEKDVDPNSMTETFVAFKAHIDTPRWKGTPFYFRTGKRLPSNVARIDIQFKQPQASLVSVMDSANRNSHTDVLTIRIQPREGISLRLLAKTPGLSQSYEPVDMDFSYSTSFKKNIIDSYEKILIDSMHADQTLFATSSEFASTWEFTNKILEGWRHQSAPPFGLNDEAPLVLYPAGTWGPEEGDELIERDGRHWLDH